jgi:hypothetical protein
MRPYLVSSTSLILLASSTLALAEGRLERAREEVRESSDDPPPKRKSNRDCDHDRAHNSANWFNSSPPPTNSNSRSSSADDDASWNSFIGTVVYGTLATPWWGPIMLLGNTDQDAEFTRFPYADDSAGFLLMDAPIEDRQSKTWSTRLSMNYGTDFHGLEKTGGRLRLDTTSRWGIDTEWDHRRERLANGYDQLSTGDVNVVDRFAQSERAQFYTGLGVNWLSDQIGTEAGFNFTYGFDLFPIQPWVLSGSIDVGQLGKATLFHGRGTVGVLLDRFELFTGYDYYNLEGVRLDGLIAGVQVYY